MVSNHLVPYTRGVVSPLITIILKEGKEIRGGEDRRRVQLPASYSTYAAQYMKMLTFIHGSIFTTK